MELLFLGTGAADFHPSLAGEGFFRIASDLRRSTSTLVDGCLLLDCGPHTADCFSLFGADMSRVTDVLFTHLHGDHYDPLSLARLAAACPHPLHIWCREGGEVTLPPGAVLHTLAPGDVTKIGGYLVTAHDANHDCHPLHYSVEKDGCRLFYGLDGAWLPYKTYYAMRNRGYDCMVLDCTVGDYEGDFRLCEHNSVPMLRLMLASFKTWGVTKETTLVVADHLARTLHPSHDCVTQALAKDGILAARDGMRITVGKDKAE